VLSDDSQYLDRLPSSRAGLLTGPLHPRAAPDDPTTVPPDVSLAHGLACRALDVRHLRTRPYRPRTNGKAERVIRTLLGD